MGRPERIWGLKIDHLHYLQFFWVFFLFSFFFLDFGLNPRVGPRHASMHPAPQAAEEACVHGGGKADRSQPAAGGHIQERGARDGVHVQGSVEEPCSLLCCVTTETSTFLKQARRKISDSVFHLSSV